jgi:GNAT superfamily N-acetyltransferase
VTQDARGCGIGRRLLEALLAWAETDGVTRVQLNSVPEARTLYERMGFGPPSERLMELRVSDRGRR